MGSAIGNGNSNSGGDGGTISITGGDVTATATGSQGAGIGGLCKSITIGGNAVVHATGGNQGAGIGGYYQKAVGNITIEGNANVTATGGASGAGIGTGGEATGEAVIIINGGTVNASMSASNGAAAIGSGYKSEGKTTVSISGGQVTAAGSSIYGVGIGGGNTGAAEEEVVVNITGGTVNANGRAGIGTANASNAKLTINISGGKVTARGAIDGSNKCAAIGQGNNSNSVTEINITGGVVKALGTGTGIGSGANSKQTPAIKLGYTDETKNNMEITAIDYNGTVTLNNNFKYQDGTGAVTDPITANKTIVPSDSTAHTHSFTYSVDGKTITATCANSDNPCNLAENKATLTIGEPDGKTSMVYDGTAKAAVLTGDTDVLTADMVYKKGDTVLPAAPSDAGSYTASISLGEATATASYAITKKPVTFASITAKDKVYDGTTKASCTIGTGVNGAVSGDSVYANVSSGVANFDTPDVGVNKKVTFSGWTLSGSDSGNYEMVQPELQYRAITPRNITVTAKAQTVDKNGTVVSTPEQVEITSGTIVSGHSISAVTLTPSDTSAATTEGTITPSAVKIIDSSNNDVTANYAIAYVNGALTVTDTSATTYGITITAGEHMTLKDGSGAVNQTVNASSAMTTVVYTANEGYYFPTDYSVAEVNGIKVTRDSYTQITISGTPTAGATITLTAPTAKTKETTPSATFTATGTDSGTLSNVTSGMKYSLDGGSTWIDISDTTVTISSDITATNGIQVKKPGNGTTTTDSDAQTINVTQPAAPTTAGKVDCMTAANNDGKLTGVTAAMEYKKSDAASWTDGTGSEITGLTPGTYYVRIKASGTALASTNQELTIATYTPEGHVAAPTFTPAAGSYTGTQTVTISCSTDGATIHYTTDGTDPTASSPIYSTAISVSATTTIKAIAVKDGMTSSEVASATYTINTPGTVATPTFSPAGGTFTSAQSVTISCSTSGAVIHYTTDGTAPTASSPTYSTAISVSTTTTIKAIAVKDGMTDSEIASATYTHSSGGNGGNTGGNGGYAPATPSNTTTTTDTSTTTNADGSKTESKTTTTETKNSDGSTTEKIIETATTTATDGSKTESKAETSTTTKTGSDGSTTATTTATETTTTTAADGTKTTTEAKSESTETLDKSGNGTVESKTTETVKDASGKVTETTVTESMGTVETSADGTKTTTTTSTAVTTDAEGNTSTVVTTEQAVETADGSTGTVTTDENGNTTAEAKVSPQAASEAASKGEAVTLPVEVKATTATETAAPVEITLPEDAGKVKVEIPVENLTPGTVAVLVKADGTEEIVKTSTNSDSGVVLTLEGSATVKIVDNTKSFGDVSEEDWFADSAAWASSHDIIHGTDVGFEGNRETTRAMMAQILFNLDGAEAPETITTDFSDVSPEDWFAESVTWLEEAGITHGNGSGGFDPSKPVTREQDVLMMYNYAKYKGFDVSARGDLAAFSDAESVSDYAREAMEWAVAAGIINGTMDEQGNITLNPQGVTTRAQVVTIVQRFCEKVAV